MKDKLKNLIPKDSGSRLILAIVVILAFSIGLYFGGASEPENSTIVNEKTAEVWTCSMHPQIQQPNPGQCPICGMELIPLTSNDSDQLGHRQIKLSETAQKLASIQVHPVERKFINKNIRMVGKIEYDETRVKYITAWVPGRIDRMYVDYTGTSVRQGDHLVDLYSPELISTQQELIQSVKTAKSGNSEMMRQNVAAIKERLRLWGLTENQISKIAEDGSASEHVTVYAPMSGIVIHKNGLQGMYVKTGTQIYTIADLSQLWVKMDAYESDVPWIRYGQEVEFETEAYPGEIFIGKIAFIDPVLNEKTRTIKVRVNVKNKDYKLKPGMFVHANVKSKIAAGGKVMDPHLSGKWICPMHPEIIKNVAAECDVCGMDLVRAEKLGYVSTSNLEKEASLVIPASAPLITGKRAVVYVQIPGREGVFEGREVTLGPRAGDYYIVKDGLDEGELVVINGNFKIDSAIQITAKPSMMNPGGGISNTGHQHDSMPVSGQLKSDEPREEDKRLENIADQFLSQLNVVYNHYFKIHYALSHDELEEAQIQSTNLKKSLSKMDMTLLKGKAHNVWMRRLNNLNASANKLQSSDNIDSARKNFESLSSEMEMTVKQFGSDGTQNIYLYHCPMAFDNKGADWLQNKEGTENPYFGSQMFKCGSQEDKLADKK